jgi:hypothetical protein
MIICLDNVAAGSDDSLDWEYPIRNDAEKLLVFLLIPYYQPMTWEP